MTRIRWTIISVAGVALILAGFLWIRSGGESQPRPDSISIAIVPLEADPSDSLAVALAHGIGEDLASQLTLAGVQVAPWVQSSRLDNPGRSIELDVTGVVRGSLEIKDGRARGEIVLYHAEPWYRVWAEPFEKQLTDPAYLERHLAARFAPAIAAWLRGEEYDLPSPELEREQAFDHIARIGEAFWLDTVKDNERGMAILDEVLVLDPECAEAFSMLGLYFYRRSASEESITQYRHALDLDPDNVEAWWGIIKAYELDGRPLEGMLLARQLPGSFSELNRMIILGDACKYAGFIHEEILLLERARQLDPGNKAVLSQLSPAYGGVGRFQEGVAAGREYLDRHGEDYWVHHSMATCFAGLGQLDSALVHYRFVSSREATGEASSCLEIGDLLHRKGQVAEARNTWTECLADFAERVRTTGYMGDRVELVRLWAVLGLADQHEGEIERLVKQSLAMERGSESPYAAWYCWVLGEGLGIMERYEECFALFKKSATLGFLYMEREDMPGTSSALLRKFRTAPGYAELVEQWTSEHEQRWKEYGFPLPESVGGASQ